jgi:AraC-like DNA-binding protein
MRFFSSAPNVSAYQRDAVSAPATMMCVVSMVKDATGGKAAGDSTFLRPPAAVSRLPGAAGGLPAPGVEVNQVRIWRTSPDSRLVWMHGVTTGYRIDPAGAYVIGIAAGRAYHLRRGRETRIVRPGQLVVLDPSAAHSGRPAEGGAWAGRLLVIELPDADDGHGMPLRGARFPDPLAGTADDTGPGKNHDAATLARCFRALHQEMEQPGSALEREGAAWSFLARLAARPGDPARRDPATRDPAVRDPAVRAAVALLHDDITRNVTLDELAAAAGLSKYELVRRFTAGVGMPPHSYQVAMRVGLARRLLERAEPPAIVAAKAGFADQSHLTRHFTRRVGLTPARYARAAR